MPYITSTTLRVARNIIDGSEYAASIITVNKQLTLDVPEDDKSYLLLHDKTLEFQHEVTVFSSSLAPLAAAFGSICLLLINDSISPFSPDALAHFVDQVLERSDFKTFKADALNECLADYKVSRTVLIPSFQLMLGRKSQFVLFVRDA